jgi:uncharacterized protein (TIGR03067 family)
MNTRTPPLLLLLLLAHGCSKPPPEDGLGPFQGEWVALELNEHGKQTEPEKLQGLTVTFDKDQLQKIQTIMGGGATTASLVAGSFEGGTFRVDNSKSPKECEIVRMYGPDLGKTQLGIFAFEDGNLKLCVGDLGAPRPADFAADQTSTLVVLKRKP